MSNIIIKKALLTEKSQLAKSKNNEHVFEVDRRTNKIEIKKFVEKFFNVKVLSVRTSIKKPTTKTVRGQKVMTSKVKKATVRLSEGNTIG